MFLGYLEGSVLLEKQPPVGRVRICLLQWHHSSIVCITSMISIMALTRLVMIEYTDMSFRYSAGQIPFHFLSSLEVLKVFYIDS